MLLTADWVLPISRAPLQDGGVLIRGNHIAEVGRADDLEGMDGAEERVDFPGCAITPGLINAHTHLSLSALEGLLSPEAFERWLPRVVAAIRSLEPQDLAASAALGARRCVESGVTVVGDIVYGRESLDAAREAGLGGVFYWEILGVGAEDLYSAMEQMSFPGDEGSDARTSCGLSPHSAYTSGPGLLAAVSDAAHDLCVPIAVHVAESRAESELLMCGTGPLLEVAQRLAPDFEVPWTGTVAYLDRLNVLNGITAVHLGEVIPTDAVRLASSARGGVTCPRSNSFLMNQVPPVRRLLESGIPVGVGTDSSASNHDLDLFEELRTLRQIDPSISPGQLLEMATSMGAVALGVEHKYGMLEEGMLADVSVFETGPTMNPEEELLRTGGRQSLVAVLSSGKWRLRDGAAIGASTDSLAEKAEAAAERARQAIA